MSDTLICELNEPPVKLLLVLVLTLLVSNAARGLASRLARSLALAAAAVLYGLCNILGFDSIDSFHFLSLQIGLKINIVIITQ